MANKRTEEPGQDPHDVDASFERFDRSERARKRKIFMLALIVVAGGLAVFFGSILYRDNRLTSNVDLDKIDSKVAERTNDPQCRDLIDQIDTLSARYFKLESQLETKLLGDDLNAHNEIRDEIARIQQRLDEISEFSLQANLRFDESRTQLDEWFDYVALELTFVDRLAREQIAKLKPSAEAVHAGQDAADARPDNGKTDNGEAGVLVAEGRDAQKTEEKQAPTQTPAERKQAALVALHESFQNFRIWHSASAHPCGAADDDETPWKPAEKDTP